MARKGENIRKRKDGRWEGRYSVYSAAKDAYKTCSVYGSSYREVREKLSQARVNNRNKQSDCKNSQCTIIFSEAAGQWLIYVLDTRKYSTYVKYKQLYDKYLSGFLGNHKLDEITDTLIETEILPHIAATLEPACISESTQKGIYSVINQVLAYAARHYHVSVNTISKARNRLTEKPKRIPVFNATEQTRLMNYLNKDMDLYKLGIIICMYTGLRLGEICSLKWSDIDFENRLLRVSSTVQRLPILSPIPNGPKTILSETPPKSACSRREIPISDNLLVLLQRYRHEDKYVIGKKKAVDPRTYQKKFSHYLSNAEIDYQSFHTIRHTFASNCAANGTDAKALSEMLGHASVHITLNRYVHPSIETKRHILNMLYADLRGQSMGQVG